MKKLNQEHLQALSSCLLTLSSRSVHLPSWFGYLSIAICDQVKVKIDKKIAAGVMPKNGVMITLTRAEYLFLMDINRAQILSHEVEFRNGLLRILEYNQKKL